MKKIPITSVKSQVDEEEIMELSRPIKKVKTEETVRSTETKSIFLQGMLICALNPKVAIFFLAFLPQFVVQGMGPVSLQLLLHGTLLVLVGLLLQSPLILMGSRIASTLRGNKNLRTWLDRCLGALFFTLGIRLAMSKIN